MWGGGVWWGPGMVQHPLHLPIAKAAVVDIWPMDPEGPPEPSTDTLHPVEELYGTRVPADTHTRTPPSSDVLERPYTAGAGGVPPPWTRPPSSSSNVWG